MTQDERLMILQMVADKKISATEAAELLRVLDRKEAESDVRQAAGDEQSHQSDQRRAGTAAAEDTSFATGFSSFIEDIVEKFTSAFSDEPRYEFPSELTGSFTAEHVPLKVFTHNGRVDVKAWDEPGYKAEILVKARGANEESARRRAQDAYVVTADEDGFALRSNQFENGDPTVSVTLRVPRTRLYGLEIKTGNGRVSLDDLPLTDGRIVTGNGRITVSGGQADRLTMKTGNGRVEVEGDIAELEAGTGNGSIRVVPPGTRSQHLRISTGNGSARIDTSRLPAAAGFKVEASTGMGSVSINRSNMVYDKDVRTVGTKHLIARTANFEEAPHKVTVTAKTGLGSVTID